MRKLHKKDLAFSISKNSMSMLNFSIKENTNVEGKNENESGIQDESQKCENFIDLLFNIRKHHSNKIIMDHNNINSLRNKFGMLINFGISETRLDERFLYAFYHLKAFQIHIN